MSYQIATLIWVLLIISVIISVLSTLFSLSYGISQRYPKFLGIGLLLLFLTAVIGWGIWAIYPLTAAGMGN